MVWAQFCSAGCGETSVECLVLPITVYQYIDVVFNSDSVLPCILHAVAFCNLLHVYETLLGQFMYFFSVLWNIITVLRGSNNDNRHSNNRYNNNHNSNDNKTFSESHTVNCNCAGDTSSR